MGLRSRVSSSSCCRQMKSALALTVRNPFYFHGPLYSKSGRHFYYYFILWLKKSALGEVKCLI